MSLVPNLDLMTDDEKLAALESIHASINQSKEIQKKKIAENVQLVLQALKRIESDMLDRVNGTVQTIENRVKSIKDGKDGINGRDGKDGKDGRPGKDGKDGRNGRDGLQGLPGADGQDGVGVSDAHIDFDGSLIITLTNGNQINVGEVVAPDLAESIKVISNGGGTSQEVLNTLASLQTQINNLIPSQTGNSGKFLTTNGSTLSWAQVAGGLNYQGTWNASTNTPTLTSGTGSSGYYYIVGTAGSTNLDGITDWQIGDWLVFNGTAWQKLDQTNLVTSVAGRTGAITLTSTDVGLGNVENKSSATIRGEITSGNVTTALGYTPLNPTTSQTANTVYAAPNGTAGAPTFRAIVAADIPTLNQNTTGTAANITASSNTTLTSLANLATVGTLTSGTWNATTIATNKGGTGLTSFTANGVVYASSTSALTTGSALTFDGTNFATTGSVTSAGASNSGNLTFTGTGNRITGDFSNATVANRVFVQTSTANSSTVVSAIPNGTGTTGGFFGHNNSDPTNSSFGSVQSNSADIRIQSGITGTGTYLPMTFYTGGSERMRLDTSGNLGIGTSSPGYKLSVASTNNYPITWVGQAGGATGALYADGSSIGMFYGAAFADGVWVNSSSTIRFRTSSTDRMILDSSGNVGIGTSSPANKLSIVGTGATRLTITDNASTGVARLIASGTDAYVGNASATGTFNIQTNSNNIATFDVSGNLGLGVTPTNGTGDVKHFEIASGGRFVAAGNNGEVGANYYYDSAYKYITTNAVTRLEMNGGAFKFYNAASGTAGTAITFTQAMTLDASGNLGIGTTSPGTRLQIGNPSDSNQALRFDFSDSSTARINSTRTGSGNTQSLILAGQDTLQFYTNGSERARIDSSGNVGIGTSSPSYKLHVAGSGDVYGQIATSNGGAYFNLDVQAATPDYKAVWGTVAGVRKWGIGNYGTSASDVIAFYTGGATERARIDSSGNLLVGTTTVGNSSKQTVDCTSTNGIAVVDTGNTNGRTYLTFISNGATTGSVSRVGTTSAVAYNTSSDYRLKENIQPMTGALAKVAALKPCTYNWKSDGSEGEGFIAHELAEVCPNAVTGEKDAVNEDGSIKPQGIDTSFLVATLTAAIKEQQALIESLTTRIAALEGK